ncbi:histidine kinase, partial [Escherichia coli]|nr:histidine kinase [Escherichia coli]
MKNQTPVLDASLEAVKRLKTKLDKTDGSLDLNYLKIIDSDL